MDANENLYGEEGPEAAQSNEPTEEKGEAKTFLIPKDVCPGMGVGDQLTARIVAVHGDEYSCTYEPKETEETPPEPATAPDESEAMYS